MSLRRRLGIVETDQLRLLAFCGVLAWSLLPWGSYDGWSMNLLAMLLCLLGTWHLLVLALEGRPLRPATVDATVPLALLATIALWQWVQVFTVSVSPHETAESALLATGFAAAALMTTELLHTPQRLVTFVWFVAIVAALQAAFGVTVVFSGEPYGLFDGSAVQSYAASGTLFNRNHFAAFLNIALALGVGLMVGQLGDTARSRREFARQIVDLFLSGKAGLRIILLIMVIGLVVSRSRMGNMGFFVALTGAAVLAAAFSRSLNRGVLTFLASIVVLDVFFVGAYFGVDQVAARIQETAQGGGGGEDRGDVVGAVLPMVGHYLPWGAGAGTFMAAFPPFRTADISAFYRNAHNDYLQVLVELGLPGALCMLAFWAWTAWASVRLLRSDVRRWRGFGFGGIMLCAYLPLHATVEFNLYIPAVALFAVVAMMIVGSVAPSLAYHEPEPEQPRGRRRRRRRSAS